MFANHLMQDTIIFPDIPTKVILSIISYLATEPSGIYGLLALVLSNKEFNKELKALIMQNNFWSTFINKNYEHAKFNVYNSVVDFANIFHKLTSFLNKNEGYKYYFNPPYVLSTRHFNENINEDFPIKYQKNVSWQESNDLVKYENERVSFKFQVMIMEKCGDMTDFFIKYNCELFNIAEVHFTAKTCSHEDYMSLWIHNKFLKSGDKNEFIEIFMFWPNIHENYCSAKFKYTWTIHNNYIWFCLMNKEKIKFYVYNIITFEKARLYEYWPLNEIGTINAEESFWNFDNDGGVLTLTKIYT